MAGPSKIEITMGLQGGVDSSALQINRPATLLAKIALKNGLPINLGDQNTFALAVHALVDKAYSTADQLINPEK